MEDGPPRFQQGSTCPAVLGCLAPGAGYGFIYGAITLFGWPFQSHSTPRFRFVTPFENCNLYPKIPQPRVCNACRLTHTRFRLVPLRSPLLRDSRLISLPLITEMFQFIRFASHIGIMLAKHCCLRHWVSPFGNPGITGWLAPPPGLSQPPTSFIASERQGIHHMPLVA